MDDKDFYLIVVSAVAVMASPGPATLAIAGTSISYGRRSGVAFAAGVLSGSLIWSISAALGLAAVLHAHAWAFEIFRYCGALYLLFLASKCLCSIFQPRNFTLHGNEEFASTSPFLKGLLIHLTNPKAILFFGSLYSIGVPASAKPIELLSIILIVATTGSLVFFGYAILFSSETSRRLYLKASMMFEAVSALFFGLAGFRLLTERLGHQV